MVSSSKWKCGALIDAFEAQGSISWLVPMDGHDSIAKSLCDHQQYHDGIFYPPIYDGNGKPLRPHLRFELSDTHRLITDSPIDSLDADYVIGLLGFILGVPLRPSGVGYLHPAAVKRGKWVDFLVSKKEAGAVLDQLVGLVTCIDKSMRVRYLRASANAYMLACSHDQPYQSLVYLYMALDRALEALGISSKGSIEEALDKLFTKLGLERVGAFRRGRDFDDGGKTTSIHRIVRNDLIHFGELNNVVDAAKANAKVPRFKRIDFNLAGEAHPPSGYELELKNLVSRALVAGMGIKCGYTSSPLGTRQRHSLDLNS